jgi:hypothetical protein
VKEFWAKHKKAIIITGGLFILLYLFYKYEQSQTASASTSPADAASQLAAQAGPYISGGGGVATTPSTYYPASNLPDYTNQPPTTTQSPGTSQSGLPNNAPQTKHVINTSPQIPTPSSTGNAPNPYSTGGAPSRGMNPNDVTNATYYQEGQATLAASHCQYMLPGVTPIPGLQACTTAIATTNDPHVLGFLPGQAGYAGAVAYEESQATNPSDQAYFQGLLNQYGNAPGPSGPTKPVSVTPAPASTPATPPTSQPVETINPNQGVGRSSNLQLGGTGRVITMVPNRTAPIAPTSAAAKAPILKPRPILARA